MFKMRPVKNLSRGDLIEWLGGVASVISVRERRLLSLIFPGRKPLTLDFYFVDGPNKGMRNTTQHDAEDEIPVLEPTN